MSEETRYILGLFVDARDLARRAEGLREIATRMLETRTQGTEDNPWWLLPGAVSGTDLGDTALRVDIDATAAAIDGGWVALTVAPAGAVGCGSTMERAVALCARAHGARWFLGPFGGLYETAKVLADAGEGTAR